MFYLIYMQSNKMYVMVSIALKLHLLYGALMCYVFLNQLNYYEQPRAPHHHIDFWG